jgi:hypothetical protein
MYRALSIAMCLYIEYGLQKSSQKRNNRNNITRRYHFNNTTAASTKKYKRQFALVSGMDLTLMRAITTKALTTVFATIMGITMILPAGSLIQIRAQGTFEDDGEFVPDGEEQTPEQKEEQEQDYDDRDLPKYDKDTGTYNDDDNNGIDDDSKSNDDDENLPTCNDSDLQYQQRDCRSESGQVCEMPDSDDECQSDKPANIRCSNGVLAETQEMCPTKKPYCDQLDNKQFVNNCFDRKDIDQTTGLYPCNDGSQKANYKDCKDVSGYNYNNNKNNNDNTKTKTDTNTIVNDPPRTTPPANNGKVCSVVEWLNGNIKCSNEAEIIAKAKQNELPVTTTPLRTSFDLVSCKYFGAQDAMNIKQMDYTLYLKCDNYPKTGDNAYVSGYADVVNARNNSILPKP